MYFLIFFFQNLLNYFSWEMGFLNIELVTQLRKQVSRVGQVNENFEMYFQIQ